MTLVDSNIFMYAGGREHRLKRRAAAFLERVADGSIEATVDAEALQEILHRYRAIGRWNEGRLIYDSARVLFPTALAVTGEVMDRARLLLDEHPQLMARDVVHAAVVEVYGLDSICTFDRDFDRVRGLRRIEPD
ncbi:MAG TPA: type II toxin-antitoxin system VapC family toxin [Bryobacteraceae bacterium]|nr:type II toxin-antitoxin system VapC family toxin [Bryobacteraceae bacterium]